MTTQPTQAEERRTTEGTVYTVTGGDWDTLIDEQHDDRIVINMGPQHPSTHGVLRLVLELEGETVTQALVVQPAVRLGAVDAEVDQLLHPARGEPVAADLRARERRLLQQEHVEPRPGEMRRGGGSGGAGADDDDVGRPVGAVVGDGRGHACSL